MGFFDDELIWPDIIRLGNLEAVQICLNRGAATNAKNDDGKLPLEIARDIGNTEIIELLQRFGAPDKNN